MAGALSFDDFKALRDKGLSPEQISSLEKGGVKPHTPDWRAHLLTLITPTTTVLGALAGAPGGPLGVAAGAGVGAASGRSLENSGRKLIGLEPNASLTSRIASATGHSLPPALNEAIDPLEQGLLGGVGEGTAAKLFGVPGKVAGAVESGLGNFANRSEAKFVRGAGDKTRTIHGLRDAPVSPDVAADEAVRVRRAMTSARDIGPEVKAAEIAARATRSAAGKAKGDVIRGAVQPGNEMTIDEVVNHVSDSLRGSMGTAPEKRRLLGMVKNRIREVVSAHSLGALKGNNLVFDMEEADRLKRVFGGLKSAKGSFEGAKKGLTPKPVLDELIHGAFKQGVEKRIPIIEDVNRGVQGAIRQHQAVAKMGELSQQPLVQALRQSQGERVAAAGARIGAENQATARALSNDEEVRIAEELARMDFNKPMLSPHFSLHGMSFPSVKAGPMARGASRILGNPAVSGTGRYGGDVLGALYRLMQEQPQPDSTGGPQ